ncbi:MAG: ribonuclease Z [Syntrophobacterales bacterium]|nr:MAG: ribonuclease Z [Syntrophobacterales bacterium]
MFSAHLINDPSADPGVYVKFKYRNEAIIFDLGEIYTLAPRQILRVRHIFISHTHMDHFIGFDHLLRICLGRNMHLSLFGPPGFTKNVEGKLAAYTWNLVHNYTNDFVIRVVEVHETDRMETLYSCRDGFRAEDTVTRKLEDPLVDEKRFTVRVSFLDHKVPSLAFAMKEKRQINIMKNALDEMGLAPGSWLVRLKDDIREGTGDDSPIAARMKDGRTRIIPLGELRQLVRSTPGQKVSYIADAVYNSDNARKIVELAEGSNILFIEAPFLEEDADIAAAKYHLTARQAGHLAREAGAKEVRIFHLSPKYTGREHLLMDEAMGAFGDSSPG